VSAAAATLVPDQAVFVTVSILVDRSVPASWELTVPAAKVRRQRCACCARVLPNQPPACAVVSTARLQRRCGCPRTLCSSPRPVSTRSAGGRNALHERL